MVRGLRKCRFLTEDLRVATENRTNVSLAEINLSIGKALAATAWYGAAHICMDI